MDAQSLDQQQKEFLSALFPPEDIGQFPQPQNDDHHMSSIFDFNPQSSQQQPPSIPVNHNPNLNGQLELLGNMMALQGIESPSSLPQYTPQILLEQQFKLSQLQQLQQLQHQIFQQQIALISSQTPTVLPEPSSELQRNQPTHFSGLPTPGSSTELRPQQNTDYVSPMILHYIDAPQETFQLENTTSLPQQQPQGQVFHQRSFTAPSNIAFQSNSMPLPTDIDFDISPLTSPWLGANQQSMAARQTSKRTASLSGDESVEKPDRKRPSPAIRPIMPKKTTRGYRSTNSTPMLRTTRSRKDSTTGDTIGDTPSPVDLTMPPPAPPATQIAPHSLSSSLSQSVGDHLTPVTPASMMNLGKFGFNRRLAPSTDSVASNANPKGQSALRPRASTESNTRGKPPKKTAPGKLANPSLKDILPAGNTPTFSPPGSQPVVQVRKTSHKAAEQKRRDSLKTTFDDLRNLLPPIPLPSDDNFPDDRILPGALPPRGPPKAGGEGPNKGVSKLQLLMCGNDFIRQLKARIERRDEEIEKLRQEILRLREMIGGDAANYANDDLDLERDLDAGESFSAGFGTVVDDEADDDGDGCI